MKKTLFFSLITVILSSISLTIFADGKVKGIYLTELTASDTSKVQYFIDNAKAVGIDTFVVDYVAPNKKYTKNIQLIKENGIRYVARVVIFPGGATPEQVKSTTYLENRLALMKQAIALGADEIQLDYIRYKPTQKPSAQNAEQIVKVIRYFKEGIAYSKVPLQADVFGIATFKPSIYIGQNLQLFAQELDAINPMVYPSHYEPYKVHAVKPYDTVYDSIIALKKQIESDSDVKIHAYIELFNYRYPMDHAKRQDYIRAQLKAVKDSDADGWYAWSAGNRYDILFEVLKAQEKGTQQLAQKD